MSSLDHLAGAPGADLVAAGVGDLEAGRETVAALLVSMAGTRLRSVGVDVAPRGSERPSHRLYDLLAAEDAMTAHSWFNSLVGRLSSFARAAVAPRLAVELFSRVRADLYRYPAIEASAFEAKVRRALACV